VTRLLLVAACVVIPWCQVRLLRRLVLEERRFLEAKVALENLST
jgi:hypothetical protein